MLYTAVKLGLLDGPATKLPLPIAAGGGVFTINDNGESGLWAIAMAREGMN